MLDWHIWLWCKATVSKHLGFMSMPFISDRAVCSPIKPFKLKVEVSPSYILYPEQNPIKKNIQFHIFQYYMITLRFPLFSLISRCVSTSLVSLTEESYSAKTLAAWVNNSVLAGAETDRLCGSSVFPHSHCSASSPQRIHYMCFGDGIGGAALQQPTVSCCFVSLL